MKARLVGYLVFVLGATGMALVFAGLIRLLFIVTASR